MSNNSLNSQTETIDCISRENNILDVVDDNHYQNNILNIGGKEIPGLQILKLFCAFLVVQIHFYSGIKGMFLPFTRIAVPIFFMITGYFLPNQEGNIGLGKLTKMFKKIFKIEIFICLVYITYRTLISYLKGDDLFLLKILDIKYLVRMVVFGDVPAVHLWYLVALLQSLAVIYIFVRLSILKWLYWCIPIGLMINFLFGRYNFLVSDLGIPNILVLSRNSITIAIPCILIGMLLRKYEHIFPTNNSTIVVAGIGIIALYVEEYFLINKCTGDIILLTVPCAIAIFFLFLRMPVSYQVGNKLALYGKKYSLDIYLWHCLIGGIVMGVLIRINLSYLGAFIVMGVTFCVVKKMFLRGVAPVPSVRADVVDDTMAVKGHPEFPCVKSRIKVGEKAVGGYAGVLQLLYHLLHPVVNLKNILWLPTN